jgi:hypothetical protein
MILVGIGICFCYLAYFLVFVTSANPYACLITGAIGLGFVLTGLAKDAARERKP